MEIKNDFFSRPQNQLVIQQTIIKIQGIAAGNDFEKSRNKYILVILESMNSTPDEWSLNCEINIGWIGVNFINLLSSEQDFNKEKMDEIFSVCFRFLNELFLSIKNDLNIEFEQPRRFALDNLNSFHDKAKREIHYAYYHMPISIMKSVIHHDNIDNIKKFNETTDKAEALKKQWDDDIEEKTRLVTNLKENLEKYKTGFNFVGLYQGFDDMSSKKEAEKVRILGYLEIFGFLIILPILTELFLIYSNIERLDEMKFSLMILTIPVISLVGIMIYFFRILLVNYKSVKSQLLQLDLRKTLCRFIQNYADYSSVIKEKDKDSLGKFENIIFSGIVADDEKLPSTFDGIDQLSGLIKSLKS